MFNELSWDLVDELLDAYAPASVYADKLPALEAQLTRVCEGIVAAPPSLDDFSSFLDTSLRGKDAVVRKIAWGAQHIFNGRSWCVGQKLVLKRGAGTSPLLAQVAALRLFNATGNGTRLANEWSWSTSCAQTTIDALVVSQSENRIYVIKGCSFSQARRMSKRVRTTGFAPLFDPTDRILINVKAPATALRSAVLAAQMLKTEYSDAEVIPIFIVVDDEYSWNFQCYDISDFTKTTDADSASLVDVDAFKVIRHSRQTQELQSDPDAFSYLPKNYSGYDIKNCLNAAPLDRPTRALLALDLLWDMQLAKTSKLVTVPATHLVTQAAQRYRIHYPDDLRRHDLEDCLRSGGFIRRARFSRNEYAITPKGVGRILLIKQKLNPMLCYSAEMVLNYVRQQAVLWAGSRGDTTL